MLQPTFFAPLVQYVALASGKDVVFEAWDNFQKQTYRNRCYIYGANGRQLLTVPVRHTGSSGRQKTRDVRIDNSFGWQTNVFRSLEASYRSSPFFEFYEDDLRPVFEKKHEFLMDLNLESFEVVNNCLGLELTTTFTDSYQEEPDEPDFRFLANAKSGIVYAFEPYIQVFTDKYGFIPNLSILDLLFNEGNNALTYLQKHRSLLKL